MFRWSFALRGLSAADVARAYAVLGLTPKAKQQDVRKAYLELAREHHPDLSGGDDSAMKRINAAYELLSSAAGIAAADEAAAAQTTTTEEQESTWAHKSKKRRSQMDRNMAAADVWMCRTDLDWETAMNDITPLELRNPANHPFSPSRFFSFEDDKIIYKMMRSGASVRQVAKTIGLEAGMVERRLSNPQFKQRIAHMLKDIKTKRWQEGDTRASKNRTEYSRQWGQAVRHEPRETEFAKPSDHAAHFEGRPSRVQGGGGEYRNYSRIYNS